MKDSLRMCLLTRTRSEPNQLLRFVWTNEGLVWDTSQKLPGRGAYLSPSVEVVNKARQVGLWKKAFRLSSDQVIDFASLNKVLDQVLGNLKEY